MQGDSGPTAVTDYLKEYIAAGFDPARFWTLTPRLYLIEMSGAAERDQRAYKMQVAMAYLGASLTRAEKLPKLESLLEEKRKTSIEEVRAKLDFWKATLPQRSWEEWRNQS